MADQWRQSGGGDASQPRPEEEQVRGITDEGDDDEFETVDDDDDEQDEEDEEPTF